MSAHSPPLPIAGSVTFLYTRDLAATLPFYRDLLGLPQVGDQRAGDGQGCRIFRTGPSSYVGLCCLAHRAVVPDGVVFTMITPDVDGWYARLKQAGADLLGPPRLSERFRVYGFFVRDPNGYPIEFQAFRDSKWGGV